MIPRELIDATTTPDGERLELAREGTHFVLRVGAVPLMSSATRGSEQEMATVAAAALGPRAGARVLVGGLGMGFTVRAALDAFGADARVTVAELLPALVRYNREILGHLAARPLDDPRVVLFEGDVREPIASGGWDVILLDVDNGPDALTLAANASLYGDGGARALARALAPGGVLVVWSAYPQAAYERTLRRAGLSCETRRVSARGALRKGSRHVLFVAKAPARRGRARGA